MLLRLASSTVRYCLYTQKIKKSLCRESNLKPIDLRMGHHEIVKSFNHDKGRPNRSNHILFRTSQGQQHCQCRWPAVSLRLASSSASYRPDEGIAGTCVSIFISMQYHFIICRHCGQLTLHILLITF